MDVNGSGQGGGSDWGEDQGGWERRIEAFVNIQKNCFFWGGGGVGSGGGGGGGIGLGGQGGCERRSKVFMKNQKKNEWGWVGGSDQGLE